MAITTLRPTADFYTEWQMSGGIFHFLLIDESVADDVDYVFCSAIGVTATYIDKFRLTDHTTETETIGSVTVYARAKCDALCSQLYLGHDDLYGSAHTLTGSYVVYSSVFTTNNGVPWTWDDIDSMMADIKAVITETGKDTDTVYLSQLYVEVLTQDDLIFTINTMGQLVDTPPVNDGDMICSLAAPMEQSVAAPLDFIYGFDYHSILEAQYEDEVMLPNKVYAMGRDLRNNNSVFSTAIDNVLYALYPELIYQIQDGAMTPYNVEEITANIQAKLRLQADMGSIKIPVNCGIQPWDVYDISDSMCNKVAAKYRIASYTMEYDNMAAVFTHTIMLTMV
jgi:hypothetical protein